MALCGKWELVESDAENFLAYMKATGVSEENQKVAQTTLMGGHKMYQVISQAGDAWTINTVTERGEKQLKTELGKATPWTTLDGREVTITLQLEGDSLVEQREGGGITERCLRSVTGDTMTMTMSVSGTSCVRKYKKVE